MGLKSRLSFTDFDDLKARTTAWSQADYRGFLEGFGRFKAKVERDRSLLVRKARRYLEKMDYLSEVVGTSSAKWDVIVSASLCGRTVQRRLKARTQKAGIAAGRYLLMTLDQFVTVNGGILEEPKLFITTPAGRRTTWREGDGV